MNLKYIPQILVICVHSLPLVSGLNKTEADTRFSEKGGVGCSGHGYFILGYFIVGQMPFNLSFHKDNNCA